MSSGLKLLPCPWCGETPEVYPKNWRIEGNAFGQVRCQNDECPANPVVNDGEDVCDERGSEAYKQAAILRWNTRAPSDAALVEALEEQTLAVKAFMRAADYGRVLVGTSNRLEAANNAAREVAANPSIPTGVRQVADKVVRDGEALIQTLDAIQARAS